MEAASFISVSPLPTLFEQAEVFIPGHSCSSEIVLDNENGNFPISGDHHGTSNAFADIVAMAAFLPRKAKPSADEYAFERFPIDRRKPRHRRLGCKRCFPPLDRNPLRAFPAAGFVAAVTRFLQDLIECSHVGAGCEKAAHSLIHRAPRVIRRGSGACDIQRHRVSDELVVFTPDLNRVVDVHRADTRTKECSNQAANLRRISFSPR